MGVHEFPCPGCGTGQKVNAPNGQEVEPRLCAACQEKENINKNVRAEEASVNAEVEARSVKGKGEKAARA